MYIRDTDVQTFKHTAATQHTRSSNGDSIPSFLKIEVVQHLIQEMGTISDWGVRGSLLATQELGDWSHLSLKGTLVKKGDGNPGNSWICIDYSVHSGSVQAICEHLQVDL